MGSFLMLLMRHYAVTIADGVTPERRFWSERGARSFMRRQRTDTYLLRLISVCRTGTLWQFID